MINRRSLLSAAAALGFAGSTGAGAQSYPSRSITLVAPFPAGGAADTIARVLAEGLRQRLGQSVVVENVTGGGGSIGAGGSPDRPATVTHSAWVRPAVM